MSVVIVTGSCGLIGSETVSFFPEQSYISGNLNLALKRRLNKSTKLQNIVFVLKIF